MGHPWGNSSISTSILHQPQRYTDLALWRVIHFCKESLSVISLCFIRMVLYIPCTEFYFVFLLSMKILEKTYHQNCSLAKLQKLQKLSVLPKWPFMTFLDLSLILQFTQNLYNGLYKCLYKCHSMIITLPYHNCHYI